MSVECYNFPFLDELAQNHSITYGGKFNKRVKELNDEWGRLVIDVPIEDVEETCCLCHQVDRLNIVGLFSQVILQEEDDNYTSS